jgi:hypothetical protein
LKLKKKTQRQAVTSRKGKSIDNFTTHNVTSRQTDSKKINEITVNVSSSQEPFRLKAIKLPIRELTNNRSHKNFNVQGFESLEGSSQGTARQDSDAVLFEENYHRPGIRKSSTLKPSVA